MRAAGAGRTALALLIVAALGAIAAAVGVSSERPGLVSRELMDVRLVRAALAVGGLALLAVLVLLAAWRRSSRGESPGVPWFSLRFFFEVLVVGSAVYLLACQPFRKEVLTVAAGLGAALWGCGLAFASALHRRAVPKGPRLAELVLFNLCLFAVLAEAGLRLVSAFFPSQILVPPADRPASFVWRQKQIRKPGTLRFGFPFNSRGYYDTEIEPRPPGRLTIASVGDSFSFGVVPHRYHFTTVCEHKLAAADVWNIGYPGLGPLEYNYLLRHEVLKLSPDVVAVNVFIGNDVNDANRRRGDHPLLRAFWDRGNLLTWIVPRRLLRLREQRRRDGGAATTIAGEDVGRRLSGEEELVAAYPWLVDPSLEKASIREDTFLRAEARRARLVCDPKAADYGALFSALDEMRRLVGDVPFVVQLIPDEFQVDDEIWREVVRRSRKRGELARDLPQERIGSWLHERGILYLDLLPVLRAGCAADRRGREHCYHLQDTHWNARGNRIAGEAMAKLLAPFLERGATR